MGANTLGGLIVRLGLDAAEFTTGLTKSEREAQQFARRLDAGIKTAANLATIAISAMAASATAAFVAIDQLAKQAGNFQDLAEKTGANAEALASFSVAAQVAGTNMETIAAASIKLTKAMTGVDDESKAAGAALVALGIPIKEFKALDPAAQIEAVAKAMAGFEDGAGKTAVAIALFGKAGADALPFLKELAGESGRQVILTQKQIEMADAYADAQARATAQLNLYAQVAATQALPAVTALAAALKETIEELLGLDNVAKQIKDGNAIGEFAIGGAKFIAVLIDQVDAFVRAMQVAGIVIGATGAQLQALGNADFGKFTAIKDAAKRDIAAIINRTSLSARLEVQLERQRKIEVGLALISKQNEDRNDRLARKPQVAFAGAIPGGGRSGGTGGAARQSEADRLLESLQKQLEKTQELTVVEQVLLDIQKGRVAGITPAIQAQLLAVAAQVDAANALKKSQAEMLKLEEDASRIRERNSQQSTQQLERMIAEQAQILEGNDALREEIAVITGGEEARRKFERAHLDSAIAIKQDTLASMQNADGNKAAIGVLMDQIAALEQRKTLLSDRSFAQQMAEDAKNLQEFKNMFADTFADAFSSFIDGSKSAKDAFKQFTDDITRQLSRLASQQIANALFGGNSGSGGMDWTKMIGSIVGLFGGGAGATGGFAMASGGPVAANQPYMVGERGPELFVPRAAGMIVPNNGMGQAGMTNVFNINVLPGANTQSAMQAGNQVAQQARRAVLRNG